MKWIWQLNGIKLNAPPFAGDYELFISQFYQQAQQLFAHVSSISIYGRGYRGHESKAFDAEKLQRENNQNFLICRYGKIDLLTISSSLESVSVCVAVGYDTSADLLVDWLFAFGCSMLQLNTTRPFCTSALELTRGRDVDDDRLRVITYSTAAVAAPPRIWLWTFHLGAVVRYGSQSYRISCWDSTSDV